MFKSLKNAVKQKAHWIARQPLHAIKYSSWGGGGMLGPSSPNSTELLTTCLPSITSGLTKFTSLFYNIHVNAKNLVCLTYMYFVWSEIRDMVNLWMKVLSSWNYMDCHQVEWHSERCWGLQEMKKQKPTRSTSLQLSILREQETWLAKPLKG